MLTRHAIIIALAAAVVHAPAHADKPAKPAAPVVGEKLDSGLGSLPPYSQWPEARKSVRLNPVPGEKLDAGVVSDWVPAKPAGDKMQTAAR